MNNSHIAGLLIAMTFGLAAPVSASAPSTATIVSVGPSGAGWLSEGYLEVRIRFTGGAATTSRDCTADHAYAYLWSSTPSRAASNSVYLRYANTTKPVFTADSIECSYAFVDDSPWYNTYIGTATGPMTLTLNEGGAIIASAPASWVDVTGGGGVATLVKPARGVASPLSEIIEINYPHSAFDESLSLKPTYSQANDYSVTPLTPGKYWLQFKTPGEKDVHLEGWTVMAGCPSTAEFVGARSQYGSYGCQGRKITLTAHFTVFKPVWSLTCTATTTSANCRASASGLPAGTDSSGAERLLVYSSESESPILTTLASLGGPTDFVVPVTAETEWLSLSEDGSTSAAKWVNPAFTQDAKAYGLQPMLECEEGWDETGRFTCTVWVEQTSQREYKPPLVLLLQTQTGRNAWKTVSQATVQSAPPGYVGTSAQIKLKVADKPFKVRAVLKDTGATSLIAQGMVWGKADPYALKVSVSMPNIVRYGASTTIRVNTSPKVSGTCRFYLYSLGDILIGSAPLVSGRSSLKINLIWPLKAGKPTETRSMGVACVAGKYSGRGGTLFVG